MEGEAELETLLQAGGVADGTAGRLASYGAMLLRANQRVNLTGARSARDLAPHVLDSLTLLPYVRGPLLDVGSGGGLPALVMAIATGMAVTLVEATARKAAFLDGVLAAFRLDGRVVSQRAELAARDPALRERFAAATARAVGSAPTVLELCLPFLEIGGIAALQRGRMDESERRAAQDAAPMLGGHVEEEVALDGDRRILLVRKLTATPPRFPRRTGVPAKRPLMS